MSYTWTDAVAKDAAALGLDQNSPTLASKAVLPLPPIPFSRWAPELEQIELSSRTWKPSPLFEDDFKLSTVFEATADADRDNICRQRAMALLKQIQHAGTPRIHAFAGTEQFFLGTFEGDLPQWRTSDDGWIFFGPANGVPGGETKIHRVFDLRSMLKSSMSCSNKQYHWWNMNYEMFLRWFPAVNIHLRVGGDDDDSVVSFIGFLFAINGDGSFEFASTRAVRRILNSVDLGEPHHQSAVLRHAGLWHRRRNIVETGSTPPESEGVTQSPVAQDLIEPRTLPQYGYIPDVCLKCGHNDGADFVGCKCRRSSWLYNYFGLRVRLGAADEITWCTHSVPKARHAAKRLGFCGRMFVACRFKGRALVNLEQKANSLSEKSGEHVLLDLAKTLNLPSNFSVHVVKGNLREGLRVSTTYFGTVELGGSLDWNGEDTHSLIPSSSDGDDEKSAPGITMSLAPRVKDYNFAPISHLILPRLAFTTRWDFAFATARCIHMLPNEWSEKPFDTFPKMTVCNSPLQMVPKELEGTYQDESILPCSVRLVRNLADIAIAHQEGLIPLVNCPGSRAFNIRATVQSMGGYCYYKRECVQCAVGRVKSLRGSGRLIVLLASEGPGAVSHGV